MKKFLLLILIIANIKTNAQLNFTKVYYDASLLGIEAHAMVRMPDKGYLIVGKASYNNGYLLKLDSAGNFVWNKSFTGNQMLQFNSIAAIDDSTYIIAGDGYNQNQNATDVIYAKVNSAGDPLWMKSINVAGYSLNGTSIIPTLDSGFLITGYAQQSVAPYNITFIAKVTSTGNLQWTKLITAGNYNYAYAVKQAADSSYLIIGSLKNSSSFIDNTILTKVTPTGTIAWAKNYFTPTVQPNSGNDLVLTNDGILTYLVVDGLSILMKTDIIGNVLWCKSYNYFSSVGFGYTSIPKVHLCADSNFVFTSGGYGSSVIKTDSAGNVIWSDELQLLANDVIENQNKEYFILGNGPIYGVKGTQVLLPQIGIIQTDSLGLVPYCVNTNNWNANPFTIGNAAIFPTSISAGTVATLQTTISSLVLIMDTGCVAQTGGIKENQANTVTVYPNPTTGSFTIKSNQRKNADVIITDVFGKEVFKTTMHDKQLSIDMKGRPNGVYFYRIVCNDGSSEGGKIMLIEK